MVVAGIYYYYGHGGMKEIIHSKIFFCVTSIELMMMDLNENGN